MPARIDLDISERPVAIIGRVYNAPYLSELALQFKFDGKDPEIVSRIKRMGIFYLIERRRESPNESRQLNNRYKKLSREIELFRQALNKNADLDLAQMIYFSALQLEEPAPTGAFPGLTQHERKQSGEPYFREFIRILDILDHAVKKHKNKSAPRRGPRINAGLDVISRQAMTFFAVELKGRRFSIDPHKPFKATPAFDFVKALVEPLDNVTDDEIVTAIRGAKSQKMTSKKNIQK